MLHTPLFCHYSLPPSLSLPPPLSLSLSSYDELLVGAPMYSDIETGRVEKGRVFVFENLGVSVNPIYRIGSINSQLYQITALLIHKIVFLDAIISIIHGILYMYLSPYRAHRVTNAYSYCMYMYLSPYRAHCVTNAYSYCMYMYLSPI